jgi:natural product biosynthesis luciferase-like monooxygenase protein
VADGPVTMPALSIFFFSHADAGREPDRYGFVLRTAALAEELGFQAVWLPERHFHRFGGLFPNPAVVAAALAMATERIALRAGSVVLPLHHVARVAEEWAAVDALSNGRVGVSLASGWNRTDFVLGPGRYDDRRERMLAGIDELAALWRGEEVGFPLGSGVQSVCTHPVPVQEWIPLWLTATSCSATFLEAGRRGLRVLTAYLQQTPDQLAANIHNYQREFAARPADRAGAPRREPHVTLMVHAHVADTARAALSAVELPLRAYQSQFLDLHHQGRRPGAPQPPLTEDERRELARYAAYKYATERGLVGDPDQVRDRLARLASIGVDEVACLVDFGMAEDEITRTLVRLAEIAGTAVTSRG